MRMRKPIVNKIMATGQGPVGMAGSCNKLSVEQLRRMEENRRKARERLSRKTHSEQPQNNTAPSQSTTAHFPHVPGRNVLRGSNHSRPPSHEYSSGTTTSAMSTCKHHDASKKVVQLVRPTVKANLKLTSKQRFEIVMPYDRQAIEVFKKTPTNAYNAKESIWSFGISVYDKLVAGLQRECRHIELSQIPRPVVALFQSPCTPAPTESDHWSGVDPGLNSTLMHFQREGIDFCIGRGGRALLADDMGLGKTLQALAVMSHYRSNWPLLIICPSSVKMTWAEACRRWISALKEEDVMVVGTGKLPSTSPPVTIISYDLATRLGNELAVRKPNAIIVDESHFLKNPKTNRCKAILPLIKSATRCLLLSGTPALSRPLELHTQISALDKSFKISRINFGIRYCSGVKGNFGWDFSGASNLSELHLYMQEKFMIRRLKIDVLDQLPSKRRQTVVLDPSLTKTQSREVRQLRQELEKAGMVKAMERRAALLPLFEKTGRLKLPAIRGYILDLLEGGRKLIVFAHHKSVLNSISECLTDKSYEHIRIDGRTPPETRQLLCDRFQHDEDCLVALLSITTANAGLTLTAASTVVFAELFWNPGILVQAEDRAYRIGQKNSVVVHYLVARETVDDFIWPLIQSKLTVLSKAGLAGDDFSATDSTLLKGTGLQNTLLDFLDKEQQQQGVGGEGMEGGGEAASSSSAGETRKSTKRKRLITEFCCEDDSDFDTRKTQKLNLPSNQATDKSSRGSFVNCSTKSGKEEMGKPSKSSEIASYILSQKASGIDTPLVKPSQDQPSTAAIVCHSPPQCSTLGGCDEGPSSATSSTVEYGCEEYNTSPCGTECGDQWLLEDCDLASFTNFDDNDT